MQPREKRQLLVGSALPAYSYGYPGYGYGLGSYGYGLGSYGYGYPAAYGYGYSGLAATHVIGKREAKPEESVRAKRQVLVGAAAVPAVAAAYPAYSYGYPAYSALSYGAYPATYGYAAYPAAHYGGLVYGK